MVMKSAVGFDSVHEFSRRSTTFRSRVHGSRTQTIFHPLYARRSTSGTPDAVARAVRDCRMPAEARLGKCRGGVIEVVEANPVGVALGYPARHAASFLRFPLAADHSASCSGKSVRNGISSHPKAVFIRFNECF